MAMAMASPATSDDVPSDPKSPWHTVVNNWGPDDSLGSFLASSATSVTPPL